MAKNEKNKTESYLQLFTKYQDDFVWVLRQQEKLRLEYLMFLKKDLPEILYKQKVKKHFWNKKQYADNVKSIIDSYSNKIEESITLLSTELLEKIGENK